MFQKSFVRSAIVAGAMLAAGQASAASGVYITEWLYDADSPSGEFVEFTNLSGSVVDFTGWSFDDDSRIPGVFDLSAFGLVAHGESVIITEINANVFRADWGLDASVKVLGGYTNNLGRNDEINLFDASGQLVDRLTYGDQSFPGTIRTSGLSGQPISPEALGANDPYLWVYSDVNNPDIWLSQALSIPGNPGVYSAAPVPVPAAVWLLGSALLGLVGISRRRLASDTAVPALRMA